jgi:hypothetical protein
MTMLPNLMLRHVILAKGLAAILTLLVLLRYASALGAFFQMSNQRCRGAPKKSRVTGLSLSLDSSQILIMVPFQDQLLQKLRAIIGLVKLEHSYASIVSFFHDSSFC